MAIIHFATTLKTQLLEDVRAWLNAGTTGSLIKIYSGAMPYSPETAVTTQVNLGILTMMEDCGVVATTGNAGVDTVTSLVLGAITYEDMALASGTATWARIIDSSGNPVMDIDVSSTAGTGALKLNTTSIIVDGPILITQFVISCA